MIIVFSCEVPPRDRGDFLIREYVEYVEDMEDMEDIEDVEYAEYMEYTVRFH